MVVYVVCTQCEFLRVYGESRGAADLPDCCPRCDSELVVREREERFEPTYVNRVSRSLHRHPSLPLEAP